jgi:hypothetical protein
MKKAPDTSESNNSRPEVDRVIPVIHGSAAVIGGLGMTDAELTY